MYFYFCLGIMFLMWASSGRLRWGLVVLIATSLKPVERTWVDLEFPISYWVYVYYEFWLQCFAAAFERMNNYVNVDGF